MYHQRLLSRTMAELSGCDRGGRKASNIYSLGLSKETADPWPRIGRTEDHETGVRAYWPQSYNLSKSQFITSKMETITPLWLPPNTWPGAGEITAVLLHHPRGAPALRVPNPPLAPLQQLRGTSCLGGGTGPLLLLAGSLPRVGFDPLSHQLQKGFQIGLWSH